MRSAPFGRHLASTCLLILAIVAGTRPATAASGSDLGFGYTWRDRADGATYQVLVFDPTNDTYTDVQIPDGGAPIGPIPLGFSGPGFPFYGAQYTQIWISEDGWISFTDPAGASHPAGSSIPDPAGPAGMLAPFWTNLQVDQAGQFVRHGRVSASDAYRIQFTGALSGTTSAISWEVLLFADGRIKFQYSRALAIGDATIGIENEAATDGIQIAAGGVVHPGFAIGASTAVEFLPRSLLGDRCGTIPVVACGTHAGTSPGPGVNVTNYGCSTTRFAAQEALYNFTLATPSRVTVNLTAATALTTFLLSECNEYECIRGPATSYSVNLGSGTYTISVDGPSAADQGPFTLDITCAPLGPTISCGDTVAGTTSGATILTNYPCAPGRSLSGPETYHELDIATTTNVRATLSGLTTDLDVLILRPQAGEITPASCIAWGDDGTVAWNATPGRYLILVDGFNRAAGSFTLEVSCRVDLDCSVIAGTIDLSAGGAATISGDNTGTGRVQEYSCAPGLIHPGDEEIWQIIVPEDGQVAVHPTAGSNHAYRILTGCNEGACVSGTGSDCTATLPAGTHYLVVDSTDGGSPYEASVVFDRWFNPWRSCENPEAPTTITDTSSAEWHFNDGAFCIEDPNSINHPDGCTFAMYLTANCGTALHIPLYDVEGGHLRVFDVFRGEYVYLIAQSPRWRQEGTEIQWQDPDCSTGLDPRWNEVVTDIFFERPEGLCGIFRLEFINHSGFVWDLYSNCTGSGEPGFMIHDSLCRALADYSPLPNVSLVDATAVHDCPDMTVTYTLRNDGCAPVRDFPVQVLDGGIVVATDIVPILDPGETTRVFSMTFPSTPTSGVAVSVDALTSVLECNEAPGSGCNVTSGTEIIPLVDCGDTCQVVARGEASAPATCEGGTVSIDASSSLSSLCPGGILEYQLRWPGGSRPWQSSPDFAGLNPADDTNYSLDVRCADPLLRDVCVDGTDIPVDVSFPPLLDPASVIARDDAPCNRGISVTWDPATFRGRTGSGTYAVYRSTVSCADAVANLPIAWLLTDTTFRDTSTVEGTTYFYVVEAEDDEPDSPCVPQGATRRGAATRVEANGGACVAIGDAATPRTDLLPRVGGTLRLGGTDAGGARRYGQDFVDLRWGSDRPPDALAGEHFHVLRSDVPDTAFALQTTDSPPISAGAFTDAAAAQPDDATYVWHYLVYSADACENENRTEDFP